MLEFCIKLFLDIFSTHPLAAGQFDRAVYTEGKFKVGNSVETKLFKHFRNVMTHVETTLNKLMQHHARS